MDIAEIPAAPRKYSFSFFAVLFFLVLPIWSSVLLSWLFVTYTLYTGRIWYCSYPGRLLFAVAVAEVLFSLYHLYLARSISGPSPLRLGKLRECQTAFQRVLQAGLAELTQDPPDEETLDTSRPGSPTETIIHLEQNDPRAVDFRHRLRTWFLKVPWSSVRLLHAQQWLYWSIFNGALPPLDQLSDAHRAALDEALDLLQKRAGWTFEEGSETPNSGINPMRLTVDPINVTWRPLTFYLLIRLTNRYLRSRFTKTYQVSYGSHKNIEYMIRVPAGWSRESGPSPIMFLHGLGLGLLQYQRSLSALLANFTDRPVLVPLLPQISQDFFHPRFLKPLSRQEAANSLAELLVELNWVDAISDENKPTPAGAKTGAVTVVSHSNGSYVHAWMLKGYPHLISRSCFVDPVTFCSWEGDVCYNFVYRPARTGIELLMRYFVGTELGVANTLQRHFDWVSNSLWYEEIPNARNPYKTMFLLGGKDDILDAERVKRYLQSHGVHKGLWYDPEGRHGQALMRNSPGFTKVLRWLKEPES